MKGFKENMIQASLKDIEIKDLEKILNWRNQEHIRSAMFNNGKIAWQQHIEWYKQLQENKNKFSKIFMVENIDYGILNVTVLDQNANTCSWGFYIGENTPSKGIGLLLGYTSLEFIFKELHFRKLCAEVIKTNKISCNYHEKLGFTLDGVLRRHIKRDNNFEDIYLYSLFSEEWEIQRDRIKTELNKKFG